MTQRNVSALAVRLGAPIRQMRGKLPLGNRRNSLDELLFILLTTMTQYHAEETFRVVKSAFSPWSRLLEPEADARLRELIKPLGLSDQKAPRVVALARQLQQDFGQVTLAPLKGMSDEDAEDYLCSLPGVGKKVARCVLMYSMGRELCPVDTHVFRVATRTGLLPRGTSYAKSHDLIHEVIPPALRYGIHVSFVELGRVTCTAKKPACNRCSLTGLCNWANDMAS